MTKQDLGPDLRHGVLPGSSAEDAPGALSALFESSPAVPAYTSAAAEVAFVAGLLGALAVPFSLMSALCLGLAAVGLVTSVLGMARSSRPMVAGGLLASVGLVLSLAILALVGLRYAGIETAFGDGALPAFADWLTALNDLVPRP